MINLAMLLTAAAIAYAIAGNIPGAIVLATMTAAIVIYWR